MTTVKHADNAIAQGEDAQITRNFINAVSPFTKLRRTTVSPLNTPGTAEEDDALPDGGNIFGIGCALDTICMVVSYLPLTFPPPSSRPQLRPRRRRRRLTRHRRHHRSLSSRRITTNNRCSSSLRSFSRPPTPGFL